MEEFFRAGKAAADHAHGDESQRADTVVVEGHGLLVHHAHDVADNERVGRQAERRGHRQQVTHQVPAEIELLDFSHQGQPQEHDGQEEKLGRPHAFQAQHHPDQDHKHQVGPKEHRDVGGRGPLYRSEPTEIDKQGEPAHHQEPGGHTAGARAAANRVR